MTAPREVLHFDTTHVGRRVLVFDELASTNDTAAGEEPGTVVVAEYQTAGRGQYGRVWQARPGTSLLLSVVLDPPVQLRRPVILTAWAAVAVAEAIQQLIGKQAVIKWPNDLLLRGKKVSGILIEQRVSTVVGVGLNLNQTVADFDAAGIPEATSLSLATNTRIDRTAALGMVVRTLNDLYDRLAAGDRSVVERAWRTRLGLVGRQVVVEQLGGGTLTGHLRDLSFDGLELLTGEAAVPTVLVPETVRHLRAA
jgi:BirA family biotin operon repressor/biotin-[acetyl-CoA-carboxylase] ligase